MRLASRLQLSRALEVAPSAGRSPESSAVSAIMWSVVVVMALLTVLPAPSRSAPQNTWNDIQYQISSKHSHQQQKSVVPVQEYMVTHTMDKLGLDYSSAGEVFMSMMERQYGEDCSRRVFSSMHRALTCVQQQLVPGDVNLQVLLQMAQSGNAASYLCRLVDLDGVISCTDQLMADPSTSCTRDSLVRREGESIAAVARAAKHLCRDEGEHLARGMRQLQTCPSDRFQQYSAGIGQCMQHFNQILDGRRMLGGAGAATNMLTDSLVAMQNVSQGCPALVRLAQCVPPALGQCSRMLQQSTTDAFREVVFLSLCRDHLDGRHVQEVIDDFGRQNYLRSSSPAWSRTATAVNLLIALVASVMVI